MVHSHWYWWLQFKAELSILVSPFFMCVTPFLCSKKHVSHIFGMFTACSAPVCNARLYLVGQHSRRLCFPVCSFPALCPPLLGCPTPAPAQPGSLWAAWSLSSWHPDPSTPTFSPVFFSLQSLGLDFQGRKKEKKKEDFVVLKPIFWLLLEDTLYFATVSPQNIAMW